jgi:periplasmic protein TonB
MTTWFGGFISSLFPLTVTPGSLLRRYLALVSLAATTACASVGFPGPAASVDSRAALSDTTVYREDQVTEKPHLTNPSQVATAMARYMPRPQANAGASSGVEYAIVIDQQGHVVDASVLRSSGQRDIDLAARRVIDAMQFSPAKVNGRPVRVRVTMPLGYQASSPPR